MSEFQTKCPGCAKLVTFESIFSRSSVCDACGTIVVRGDYGKTIDPPLQSAQPSPNLSNGGRIDAPIASDSPLKLYLSGTHQGHRFTIRGVVRLEHDAGGFWDEWYLLFDDGRWGWLAEIQRLFYLTFEIDVPGAGKLPSLDELALSQRLRLRPADPNVTVAEKGTARPIAARGEIPYALRTDQDYAYADFYGPAGRFGTIDYETAPPRVYYGSEVHLGDLHLDLRAVDYSHTPHDGATVDAACPLCGHSLRLYVPHKSVRVGCTNCMALLDAYEGQLQPSRHANGPAKPKIPIGTQGQIRGNNYTVIGFISRRGDTDSEFSWDEYLLYNPTIGYRWLTSGDDHWNFVEPIPPGDVQFDNSTAKYQERSFRWSEQDRASVTAVLGEFYWKVEPDEKVWTTDYVQMSELLTREIMHGGTRSGEISWSHAYYVPVAGVVAAFGLKNVLRQPRTTAANQPSSHGMLYLLWAIMAVFLVALALFFHGHAREKVVLSEQYTLPVAAMFRQQIAVEAGEVTGVAPNGVLPNGVLSPSGTMESSGTLTSSGTLATSTSGSDNSFGVDDDPPIFFSAPFEVRGHENLQVEVEMIESNEWLQVDGDLVDEKSGVVQEFTLPVSYETGVTDGESWTEGSKTGSIYLSSLPAGQYSLRITGHHEPQNFPVNMRVRVIEDSPRWLHFLLAFLFITIVPAVRVVMDFFRRRSWTFEA